LNDGRARLVSLYLLSPGVSTRSQRIDVLDATTGTLLASTHFTDYSRGYYAIYELSGSVIFRMTRTGDMNAVVSALFIDPVPVVPEVQFVGADTVTRGSWKSKYGKSGSVVIGDESVVPAGISLRGTGGNGWVWESNSSIGSALNKTTLAGRIAACWYAHDSITVTVGTEDANTRKISLYVWDAYHVGRSQRIEVIEPKTGTILHSYDLSNYGNGVYLSWEVKGTVAFRLANTATLKTGTWNAVLSGIFFDSVQ
jgi:hypothetical protein